MKRAAKQPMDEMDFEHDPRYAVSLREAWICIAYWVVFTAVMVGVAWGIAGHRNPAETSYIAGFPDWFFWSGIIVVAVFSIIPAIMVKFLFTELDLEPLPTQPGRTNERAGGQR